MAARERAPGRPTNYEAIEEAQEAAEKAKTEYVLSKTKLRGVYLRSGPSLKVKNWRASIYYGGKAHYLGSFGTAEGAARACDNAARKHAPGRHTNF